MSEGTIYMHIHVHWLWEVVVLSPTSITQITWCSSYQFDYVGSRMVEIQLTHIPTYCCNCQSLTPDHSGNTWNHNQVKWDHLSDCSDEPGSKLMYEELSRNCMTNIFFIELWHDVCTQGSSSAIHNWGERLSCVDMLGLNILGWAATTQSDIVLVSHATMDKVLRWLWLIFRL